MALESSCGVVARYKCTKSIYRVILDKMKYKSLIFDVDLMI